MRIRDLYRALNAVVRAKSKIEKMNEKYPKLYKEELDEIGKSVIAQWYAKYDPIYYHRDRSLYHTYDISLEGTLLTVDFDQEYMDQYINREYNEWIYENSFEHGYHGGGIPGGKKDGGDNIPYWRTPFPELTSWGRPAKLSFSPFNRMYKLMDKKIKEINRQKQNEFDQIVAPVERALKKII